MRGRCDQAKIFSLDLGQKGAKAGGRVMRLCKAGKEGTGSIVGNQTEKKRGRAESEGKRKRQEEKRGHKEEESCVGKSRRSRKRRGRGGGRGRGEKGALQGE